MSDSIGRGKTVILVYGHELKHGNGSGLYGFLNRSFKNVSRKGIFSSCPWVYVNIETKRFFPGIPGIKITECLNNHAVTIKEFYTIYEQYNLDNQNFDTSKEVLEIYSKYVGKDPFVFYNERFDCDKCV